MKEPRQTNVGVSAFSLHWCESWRISLGLRRRQEILLQLPCDHIPFFSRESGNFPPFVRNRFNYPLLFRVWELSRIRGWKPLLQIQLEAGSLRGRGSGSRPSGWDILSGLFPGAACKRRRYARVQGRSRLYSFTLPQARERAPSNQRRCFSFLAPLVRVLADLSRFASSSGNTPSTTL